MEFYTLLTDLGKVKLVQAQLEGRALRIKSISVGDGGDGYYEPHVGQLALVNEQYRGDISKIYKDAVLNNRLVVEAIIPSNVGGFYVREAGLFDDEKNLIAIAKIPESYKPLEDEGSTRDFVIKIIVELDNTLNVNIVCDSNVAVASLDFVENVHNKDPNAHYRLIDADKVDGHHAGNNKNDVALSNGEKCQMLNADLLDGFHAGNGANEVLLLDENALVPENNLKPYASKDHTHPMSEIITSEQVHGFHNMQIQSGFNEGVTTYVYPPTGFTMDDLLAFIPSIRTIYFSGTVDWNDSLYCHWSPEPTRVAITCYNTEQRWTPSVNWLAIWRKKNA